MSRLSTKQRRARRRRRDAGRPLKVTFRYLTDDELDHLLAEGARQSFRFAAGIVDSMLAREETLLRAAITHLEKP